MKYVNYKTINKIIRKQDKWPDLWEDNPTPNKKNIMDIQHTEERLWSYIDGTCDTPEKSAIEKLIDENLEWRQKYQELLLVHELINGSELEVPSMRFTKNVMEEIAKYQVAPAAKNYIDKKIIYGIGTFFLTMIVGILIYAFAQIHFTGTGNPGSSEIISKYNPGNVEWAKYFSSTSVYVFLLVNVVLGFVFFDKYLQNKKMQSKHK
jgi:hypothetical protein